MSLFIFTKLNKNEQYLYFVKKYKKLSNLLFLPKKRFLKIFKKWLVKIKLLQIKKR